MENQVKVAALISFITHAAGQTLDEHAISVILKMVADLRADHLPTNRLLDAVRYGRKIDAIKEYRTLTGSTLLDAKNAIEGNWPHPLNPLINSETAVA